MQFLQVSRILLQGKLWKHLMILTAALIFILYRNVKRFTGLLISVVCSIF